MPSVIETATFRLLAQCINPLRYRVNKLCALPYLPEHLTMVLEKGKEEGPKTMLL
jgi:hypothetical protein